MFTPNTDNYNKQISVCCLTSWVSGRVNRAGPLDSADRFCWLVGLGDPHPPQQEGLNGVETVLSPESTFSADSQDGACSL